MNATKYAFRIAVAATAFLIGHSAYAGARYVLSYFEPVGFEITAAIAPPDELPVISYSDNEPPEPVSEINMSGYYYLFDEALLKGCPDFDYFAIAPTGTEGMPVPPSGAVHTKQEHKFVSVSINGDRIA